MSTRLTLYRRLFAYVRPHVPVLIVGGLLALVVAAMEGSVAWLVKPAMDDIFLERALFADDSVRTDAAAVSDHRVGTDHGERIDRYTFPELDTAAEHGGRMDRRR